MLIPAYWYPSGGGVNDDWFQLAAAAKYMHENGKSGYDTLIAIGNVDSGPGKAKDPNYASAFAKLRASGGKVVGYVFTDFGKAPIASIEKQIDQWVAFYGPELDGIFLDAWGGAQKGNHSYYSTLQKLIKDVHHLKFVIGNSGSPFDVSSKESDSSALADIFCLVENAYPAIKDGSYSLPAWLNAEGNSNKGAVAFYQLPASQPVLLTSIVQVAKTKGAAWIYCTDNQSTASGNPWGTLPGVASGGTEGQWNAYWGNEQWSVAQAHN